MSEILGRLYLGDLKDASDPLFLSGKRITGIMSCCSSFDFPDLDSPDIEQFRVDVEDISAEPILTHLDGAVPFIDKHLATPLGGVLVHCRSGVSRSATIVIAYLMRVQHLTLRESFLRVISRRPCICPNIGFMNQLVALEKSMGIYTESTQPGHQTGSELKKQRTATLSTSPPPIFFSPAAALSPSPPESTFGSSTTNTQRLRQLGAAMMTSHYLKMTGHAGGVEDCSPPESPPKVAFTSRHPPIPPVPSGVSTRAALSTPGSPARRPRRPPDYNFASSHPGGDHSPCDGHPTTPSLSMAKYISWYTAYGKQRPPVPSLAP